MRVYHFIDEIYGLENLKNKRLKISQIKQINDIFEFLFFDLSDTKFRQQLRKLKNNFSKHTGILCFTKSWKNPVLWSHYANRHKGICLGFDVPDNAVFKINYLENRHPISIQENLSKELLLKCLTTKYSQWSYEEEYRMFVSLEIEENGLYFCNFGDDLVLKEVIIGSHSRTSRWQVEEAIGRSELKNIEVIKARAAFKTFEIVRNDKKDKSK